MKNAYATVDLLHINNDAIPLERKVIECAGEFHSTTTITRNSVSVINNSDSSLYNYGRKVTINGYAGDDRIYNYGDKVTINGGAGDDEIDSEGSQVTISGGTGNDHIRLWVLTAPKNMILYESGDGNDIITDFDSTSTLQIDGGTGTYSTQTSGDDVLVSVGTGVITLQAVYANADIIHINGDVIPLEHKVIHNNHYNYRDSVSVYVEGEYGDRHNISNDGSDVTIYGSASNESINSFGWHVLIFGNSGRDTIDVGGRNNSIHSGSGNDLILLGYSDNDLIQYQAGNDTIENFNGSDTLQILGSYTRSTVDDDVIFTVADGSVILKNAATLDTINFVNDTIPINTNPSYMTGTKGDDSIENSDENILIYGDEGNDYISNRGRKITINAGNGDDTISNYGNGSEVNDLRLNNAVSINGGDGNDDIWNHNRATITGGKGNDRIHLMDYSYDELIQYNTGDGYDIIDGFNSSMTLQIDGGTGTYSTQTSGYDVFVKVGSGTIILSDVYANTDLLHINGDVIKLENKAINLGDSYKYVVDVTRDSVSVIGSEEKNHINFIHNTGDKATITTNALGSILNTGDSVKIDCGSENCSIHNFGDDVTIKGGEGNDTIITQNTFEDISISGDTGNDYIFLENNFLRSNRNALITYSAGDGNDTIEGFSENSTLSISGSPYSSEISGEDIIVTVINGSITLKGTASLSAIYIDAEESDLISLTANDKMNSEITLPAQTETIDASKRTKPIKITGNANDNSIVGGRGNDTLDSAGGDDTLTGGKGSDLFIFSGVKNVITDYEKKDKIIIGDKLSYSDFEVDGNDVVLNFGKNSSLTIKDGAGKKINMNSTVNFYTAEGVLDKNKKSIILATNVENFTASAALKTIDSSATGAIKILGNTTRQI